MPGMSIGGVNGRPGGAGILAAPGRAIGSTLPASPNFTNSSRPFRSRPLATTHVAIWGVTRDGAGTIIPNCRVQLYRDQQNVHLIISIASGFLTVLRVVIPEAYNTPIGAAPPNPVSQGTGSLCTPGELVAETRSDANGNYIFWSPHVSGPFWIVAWQDQDASGTLGWSGATNKDLQPEFVAAPPF